MNRYYNLKKEYNNKVNKWVEEENKIFFAFSKEKYQEGLKKIGLQKGEILVHIGGGGYVKKGNEKECEDVFSAFEKVVKNHEQDYEFMVHAFEYELGNHEFIITGRVKDAIETLGLTYEEVENNPLLKAALEEAKLKQIENPNNY